MSSHSKPWLSPGDWTSQSAGTSKAMPHLGFTTTFQPATVAFAVSLLRGLSSVPVEEEPEGEAEPDVETVGLALPLPASTLSSSPSTRNPVTPAATTTAMAATIAISFVRLPPPEPFAPGGGVGAPAGDGAPHCGCWA